MPEEEDEIYKRKYDKQADVPVSGDEKQRKKDAVYYAEPLHLHRYDEEKQYLKIRVQYGNGRSFQSSFGRCFYLLLD